MKFTLKAGLFLLLGAFASAAWSQAWPTRTVTLVVPFAAGGPTDVVARTLAASMSRTLGQSMVVENKLGAGGTIAANYVAKANPYSCRANERILPALSTPREPEEAPRAAC